MLYGYTSRVQTSAETYFLWPNMFIHKHNGFADEISSLSKYEVRSQQWDPGSSTKITKRSKAIKWS